MAIPSQWSILIPPKSISVLSHHTPRPDPHTFSFKLSLWVPDLLALLTSPLTKALLVLSVFLKILLHSSRFCDYLFKAKSVVCFILESEAPNVLTAVFIHRDITPGHISLLRTTPPHSSHPEHLLL